MKKSIILAASATLLLSACGSLGSSSSSSATSAAGSALGSIISAATNGNTIGNILSSVIGTDKLSASDLCGTWRYSGPGCAFTSENALAKAGGEVAATEIKQKLNSEYKSLGFSSSNTYIQLNSDKTFTAKVDGKSLSGTYTYTESNSQIVLKGLLLSVTGYAKRSDGGISLLFESKKLLTLLQTVASLSGNSALETVGDLSKNYSGVRLGFDMKK